MAPLPNPTNPNATTVPEELLVQWQEPPLPAPLSHLGNPRYLWLGVGGVIVVLFVLTFVLHNTDFALSAVVLLSAVSAIYIQQRRPAAARTVSLSTTTLSIGRRSYPLNTLAGFWLQQSNGLLVINIEPQKPSALPITALYPSENAEECRDLLLEVLPEVEPRAETLADRLTQWIRF